jgi:hypothetical protein
MAVSFLEHDGLRFLFIDFARLRDEPAIFAVVAEAREFVARLPKRKEQLVLVDMEGLRYTNAVLDSFKALVEHNAPWVHASAVFGMSGLGNVAFRAVNLMSGSRMRGFEKREEAVAWLSSQK